MPAARAHHRRQLVLLRQRSPDHRPAPRTRRPAPGARAAVATRPRLATPPPTAMSQRSQIARASSHCDAQDPAPILVTGVSWLRGGKAAASSGQELTAALPGPDPASAGGARTPSSTITGHRQSSLYSAGPPSDHHPSRSLTGLRRAPWYCLSRARQLSRSCSYRSARSRCRSAAPADSATPNARPPTSERPVAVTQRSSARYRHWPFRCCSNPDKHETHSGPASPCVEALARPRRRVWPPEGLPVL